LIKTWRTKLQPIVVDSVEDLVVETVDAVVEETADVVAAVDVAVDADVAARKTRSGCL
jgi:accessory colonization factor AcfC